jgi:predicted dehydrogenase
MDTRKARIAIIGTGWWATQAHIPSLKDNPDAELVALADTNPEALERASASYHVTAAYSDYHEMLAQERLDGVIVCVHHAAHYEVARDCLAAGLHVLVEKPMVLKTKHAYELEQLAKAQSVELMIGYSWLHTDFVRQAREILQSGALGNIQYVSCLFSSMVIEFLRGNDQAYGHLFNYPVTGPGNVYADPKRSGGGQGQLQVTHSAASMFYATGLKAETVSCFMENFDVAVDVADAMAVRFVPVNGVRAVGVIGSTGNIAPSDGGHFEIQVYCERGRVVINHNHWQTDVRYADGREQHFASQPGDLKSASSQNLVEVILGRATNHAPAEIGVRVVELLDAAYRSSAANGMPVSVKALVDLATEEKST